MKVFYVVIPVFIQVHGKDHRILKGLRFNLDNLAVAAQFVEAVETEGVSPVFR